MATPATPIETKVAKAEQIEVKGNPNVAKGDPIGVKGIDHIEFYVDDAEAWAKKHEFVLGMRRRFRGDPSTGLKGRNSIVTGQGRINFVFTEPADGAGGGGLEHDLVAEHVAKHGNGVKNVCFNVKDPGKAVEHVRSCGIDIVAEPSNTNGFHYAAIQAYGDTIHGFAKRDNPGEFAPGFVPVEGGEENDAVVLAMVDHVVANVEDMNEWVDYYARVFGFDERRHFDINTGKSALMSKVVGNEEGYIKLPINEPSSQNSQIQEFLDEYKGPGVQHIALLTPDIVTAVSKSRERGFAFLEVPAEYYGEAKVRVGEIKENWDDLQQHGVLIDRDRPDGYLLQLFTQTLFDRPTLFYEIIQRQGNSDGFGEGNFKALFEAIERDQARRGVL